MLLRAVAMRRLASASAHHKHLQPVLDIGEAHIGVVIERQNIRMRIAFLELLDDAAPTTWLEGSRTAAR